MIKKVIKRDGAVVDFNTAKIYQAIEKAFIEGKQDYNEEILMQIVMQVVKDCAKIAKNDIIGVEEIQNSVEEILKEGNYPYIGQLYSDYRKQREKIRNLKSHSINYEKLISDYININDWRVKENSTVTYSLGGLILSNSGAVTANYWLSNIYDEEIANAHRNADIHIHDLSMLSGYCAGWSLKQLIKEGLGGVNGKITSSPASHLSTLCNQMVNFLGIMQNEWAGAQAFSSFDTYLAPFVKVDNLSYKEVKQCIQSFVYGVNTPSRWGTQAPFTNITLDWTVPADLAELNCIVGGRETDFKYKDCKKEMDMINKAFIEIMTEGDANGRGFQYPIPTYSITKDFDWSDTENNRLLFEMTAKYGTPYFSNYINSDMEPSDVRSMCPLTSDTKIMVKSSVGISIQDIKTLADNQAKRNTHYEVWTKDGWKKATFNNQKMTDIYAITLSNGVTVKMGENHLQPTKRGTVSAKELVVGDLIPFNKKEVKVNNLGSRDLGYVIGAYMGDGSRDDNAIVYSLDAKEKDDLTEQELTRIWNTLGYEVKVTKESTKPSVRFVRVNGKPYTIVSQFVLGDNALNKKFSQKVWNMGVEFKKGLIAGYAATDGARDKKRLYTSSSQMREDLMSLFASIGRKALGHYEDNRTNRLGKETNYRIDYPERTSYGTYFSEDEDYNYYSITSIEKVKDSKTKLYCLEVDNDDHLFMLANGMITHNCRLRLDLRELRKKSGGFFGSGESTGSVGVVTINIPRIAYLSKNEEEFYARLDKMMDIAARSLKNKRDVITKLLEDGLYPYTKRYLGTFNNHFSTIGLVGMNEACLNAKWIGKDLTEKVSQEFTKDVLNHMRNRLSDYQEMYGDLYNLEATPAESTSYRLAKHDKEQFPNIITSVGLENDTPYYTNSSHLPVSYTASVFEALDIQDELQTLYTSGTVFHAFLGEKLPNWESTANLVRKIAENYKLPYYTISPTYSVCTDHGYIIGEHYKCPKCGKPTEVYSRITGYYRPVQNWNDGKLAEFKNRKLYENFELTKNKKEDIEKIEESKKATTFSGKPLLFTTPTCPNCPIAKNELDCAGIEYEAINANENIDLVEQYGIMQAPTLVVFEDNTIKKYVGVGRIKKYLDSI